MKSLLFSFVLVILLSSTLQQSYDPTTAFEMLRASSAAYCTGSQLQNMNCGPVCNDLKGYSFLFQFIYQINSFESISYSMFVNPDTQRLVLSFRGSHSVQQLIDEIENGGSMNFDLYDIPNAETTAYFYSYYTNNIRSNFWTNFKQELSKYPDYQLFFVGHSLGGAFATIALLDVSLSGIVPKDRIHMYNYGSPRVGNAPFVAAVEASAGELYRVVHYKDLVPHIPLCEENIHGVCQPSSSAADVGKRFKDGSYIWNAWHVAPEVFYEDEASTQYKICTQHEDITCSDQYNILQTSISDHLMYLGVSTHCPGSSDSEETEVDDFLTINDLRPDFVNASPWIFNS